MDNADDFRALLGPFRPFVGDNFCGPFRAFRSSLCCDRRGELRVCTEVCGHVQRIDNEGPTD